MGVFVGGFFLLVIIGLLFGGDEAGSKNASAGGVTLSAPGSWTAGRSNSTLAVALKKSDLFTFDGKISGPRVAAIVGGSDKSLDALFVVGKPEAIAAKVDKIKVVDDPAEVLVGGRLKGVSVAFTQENSAGRLFTSRYIVVHSTGGNILQFVLQAPADSWDQLQTTFASVLDEVVFAPPLVLDANPSPEGRIAFSSNREGGLSEIYSMNPDGSGIKRIAKMPGDNGNVAWSPAGRRIAFTSDRDGHPQIYVMNADGSDVRRLTNSPAIEVKPEWSPDGLQIALMAIGRTEPKTYSTVVMNADGSGRRTIQDIVQASWSPDGRSLIGVDPDGRFHLIAVSGPASDRILSSQSSGSQPRFSPDGRFIVFYRVAAGNTDIYVANADGTSPRRLTTHPAVDDYSHWSPDGRRIVFASERDGNKEIYVMNADGSGQTRITNNPRTDNSPSWSVPLP